MVSVHSSKTLTKTCIHLYLYMHNANTEYTFKIFLTFGACTMDRWM